MDVPELVQEESFVEPLAFVQEYRAAECKPCHVRGAERPSADAQGKTPDTESRVEKLRKPFRQLPGQLDFLSS
jgi:hypothetical protein